MTRWNLNIPEETDKAVRSFLARKGDKEGDLSKFTNDALRREILRQTVQDIQEQNLDLSEEEAVNLANEAVASVRARRS